MLRRGAADTASRALALRFRGPLHSFRTVKNSPYIVSRTFEATSPLVDSAGAAAGVAASFPGFHIMNAATWNADPSRPRIQPLLPPSAPPNMVNILSLQINLGDLVKTFFDSAFLSPPDPNFGTALKYSLFTSDPSVGLGMVQHSPTHFTISAVEFELFPLRSVVVGNSEAVPGSADYRTVTAPVLSQLAYTMSDYAIDSDTGLTVPLSSTSYSTALYDVNYDNDDNVALTWRAWAMNSRGLHPYAMRGGRFHLFLRLGGLLRSHLPQVRPTSNSSGALYRANDEPVGYWPLSDIAAWQSENTIANTTSWQVRYLLDQLCRFRFLNVFGDTFSLGSLGVRVKLHMKFRYEQSMGLGPDP